MHNVGDTIPCSSIEEMLELHEKLSAEGWDVEFKYSVEGEKFLLLKGKEGD